MIPYIISLLPKLQAYSKKLDETSLFVDQFWVVLEQDSDIRRKFNFRSNNELIVSTKGEVISGKWEYLPYDKSLLIEFEGKKQLLNQGFIEERIMILKKDDSFDYLILANSNKLKEITLGAITGILEEYTKEPEPVPKRVTVSTKEELLEKADHYFTNKSYNDALQLYKNILEKYGWDREVIEKRDICIYKEGLALFRGVIIVIIFIIITYLSVIFWELEG